MSIVTAPIKPPYGLNHDRRVDTLAESRRPLRPTRLVPVRRRVNPAIAGRLFQIGDAVLLLITLGSAASKLGWLAIAGVPAGLVGALLLGACGVYGFPRGERLRAHLALVLVILATATTAFAVAVIGPSGAVGSGAVAPLGAAALGVTLLHAAWWSLIQSWRRNELACPRGVIRFQC